jgi:putative two-component system response regulator
MVRNRILIIDDNKAIHNLLESSFKIWFGNEFEIYSAFNGKSGIDKFLKKKPEISIIDYIMPQLDGIKVLKRIREKDKDAQIIFISGNNKIREKALKWGASIFLGKEDNEFFNKIFDFIKQELELQEKKHNL